jgi:hypothetical protein
VKADHVGTVPGERTTYPEGKEHFSIWLREPGVPAPKFIKAWANEPWPEFIEGYHYDFRQPSRLLPLLARRKEKHATEAQATPNTSPEATASPTTRSSNEA